MARPREHIEWTRRQIQAEDWSGEGSVAPPCMAENMFASPGGRSPGWLGWPGIPGIPPALPIICCSIAIMGSWDGSGPGPGAGNGGGVPFPLKAKGEGNRGCPDEGV